jgi:hypothetical protein
VFQELSGEEIVALVQSGVTAEPESDKDQGDDVQRVAIIPSEAAEDAQKLLEYIELHPKAFRLGLLNAVRTIRRTLNEKSMSAKMQLKMYDACK